MLYIRPEITTKTTNSWCEIAANNILYAVGRHNNLKINEMKTDNEYKQWLIDLKTRIRQSQIKAAVKVNTELLRLYWDLGQDIVVRQMEAAWGSRSA